MLSKIRNPGVFLKNTAYLVSGTALAQLIGILITPILSRFFTPSDFGLLGTVVTISMILSTTGTFRYEMGIVVSKNNREAFRLIFLSFAGLISLTFLAVIASLNLPILDNLGISYNKKIVIYSVGVLSLFLGIRNILTQWQNKNAAYKLISRKTIYEKVSGLLVQVTCGVAFGLGIGLVLGNIIAAIIASISLSKGFIVKKVFQFDTFRNLKNTAFKYYRLAVFSTSQNLLNSVTQALPILMLDKYFSPQESGAYFFGIRLLAMPSVLISGAVRQVFYKESADTSKDNIIVLRKKYFKLTASLILIILVPALTIFFFGPQLFMLVFGEEWKQAGEFAKWVILWVSFSFVNTPSSVLYYIYNKQNIHLVLEIMYFLLSYFALYFGGMSGDILSTIKLFSLSGVLFNSCFIGYMMLFVLSRKK